LIRQASEAIGLAMATEETQARLHGQGARPGGILTTPNTLTKEQVERIKAQFADGYSGVANAFKTLLLDNGMKFEPWQMSGVDAQHLETRRHQIEEICRFFRVFPSMIGYSDKTTTYASAEAFFTAHVTTR
jgi:HK97 family phage portal protein